MATTTQPLSCHDLWQDIQQLRQQNPLIHCITNLVVMNLNANVLLAVGASPVMAHAQPELDEMVTLAQALLINVGTLDPGWLASMQQAMRLAKRRQVPIVLDPVGAGATRYRNQSITELLKIAHPTVIRGNGSEIASLIDATSQSRGVDCAAIDADKALRAAQQLAIDIDGVVVISGAIDHIVDGQGRHAQLANGHPWMTKITGLGCSATALVAAFSAIQPDSWRAATAAMALLGIAGEIAAAKAQQQQAGVGTMAALLLDQLQLMDEATFQAKLRLQVKSMEGKCEVKH